nr:sulfotransferase 1C4-like [Dermacentor andersoni]
MWKLQGDRPGLPATDREVTKKPKFMYVEGIRLSPALTQDSIVFSLNFDTLSTDIMIDSHPGCGKSGVYTAYQRLFVDRPLLEFIENLLHTENCSLKVDSYRAPRIIKTHVPFNGIANNQAAKGLSIPYNGIFEDVFECFIRGETEYNDYFDPLLPWWSYKNQPTILFLAYETMKKEPKEHMQIIAKFLGGVANDFIKD